ncbi:MAG: NADPH:quinone reductase [Haloferacaceae archaeon]
MRAVRIHEPGEADALSVDEVETPDPGPGEVRVEAAAVGVNPVDAAMRTGAFPVPDSPHVPGTDVAGRVVAAGADAGFEPGDRVWATALGHDRPGTYAEEVIVPADRAAPLPDGVGFDEAAALGLVGATAWRALVVRGDLDPAETALVHGGAGGVGHVAVQLASAAGARVCATARDRYAAALRDLGAEAVVDYRHDDVAAAVREAVGAVDVAVETLAEEQLATDAAVAGSGARALVVGNRADDARLRSVGLAKARELDVRFVGVFNTPDVAGVLDRLAYLVTSGRLAPTVAGRYDLADAAAAHRRLEEESFLGKLILEP